MPTIRHAIAVHAAICWYALRGAAEDIAAAVWRSSAARIALACAQLAVGAGIFALGWWAVRRTLY